jgi:hypothetical protein
VGGGRPAPAGLQPPGNNLMNLHSGRKLFGQFLTRFLDNI